MPLVSITVFLGSPSLVAPRLPTHICNFSTAAGTLRTTHPSCLQQIIVSYLASAHQNTLRDRRGAARSASVSTLRDSCKRARMRVHDMMTAAGDAAAGRVPGSAHARASPSGRPSATTGAPVSHDARAWRITYHLVPIMQTGASEIFHAWHDTFLS
jgi:hypothetical protein